MSALLYYRTLLTVCDRYLHAPEDSAQKFDAEGFFKTGDFAVRQNGRIIFKGRANMDCKFAAAYPTIPCIRVRQNKMEVLTRTTSVQILHLQSAAPARRVPPARPPVPDRGIRDASARPTMRLACGGPGSHQRQGRESGLGQDPDRPGRSAACVSAADGASRFERRRNSTADLVGQDGDGEGYQSLLPSRRRAEYGGAGRGGYGYWGFHEGEDAEDVGLVWDAVERERYVGFGMRCCCCLADICSSFYLPAARRGSSSIDSLMIFSASCSCSSVTTRGGAMRTIPVRLDLS